MLQMFAFYLTHNYPSYLGNTHPLLILKNFDTVPHIQIFKGSIRNQIFNMLTVILSHNFGAECATRYLPHKNYPTFVYLL